MIEGGCGPYVVKGREPRACLPFASSGLPSASFCAEQVPWKFSWEPPPPAFRAFKLKWVDDACAGVGERLDDQISC